MSIVEDLVILSLVSKFFGGQYFLGKKFIFSTFSNLPKKNQELLNNILGHIDIINKHEIPYILVGHSKFFDARGGLGYTSHIWYFRKFG
jgi:hypothetical protein